MADIQVYKRVVDYVGINAKPIPERSLLLFKDLAPVLALLQGMGSDGAQLLQVDANGNLKTTLSGVGTPAQVQLVDLNSVQILQAQQPADALTPLRPVSVGAMQEIFNNATWDRLRSASAANLATLSGLGAALTTPPGQWSVQHSPVGGTQATITRAAGGAGIRNVCTGFGFGFSAGAAVVANTIIIQLRDGASGAGTILKSWAFDLPGAIIAPFGIEVSGVEIVGTANTAMTMEFVGGLANLREYVNLSGHLAS